MSQSETKIKKAKANAKRHQELSKTLDTFCDFEPRAKSAGEIQMGYLGNQPVKTMPEAVAEAQRIISEYAQKCSTVDEGNLYFAATQLENAYSALTKQVAALKAECERLKNELDEMTLRFQALQSGFEIKKLKSENAALVAENLKLERALAIESSEPRDRSQEAAHYNWLDDQNAALTLENTDFRAALVEIGIGEVDYGNGQMGNMGIDEAMAIARAVLSKHAKKESK